MNLSMHKQYLFNPRATAVVRTLAMLLAVSLCGCVPPGGIDKSRDDTFKQYENLVRWSRWDGAANFVAPEYLVEHPISNLDMDRLRMFKVTNYTLRAAAIYDEGMTAAQTVEIKMYNSTQAIERTIIDEQVWRYDPEAQQWLLWSGLPDPTKRR
jgi:hypothetical protein